MSRPTGKWPHYAEWGRMEAVARLMTIDQRVREAQCLITSGRATEAIILLGDVRGDALEGRLALEKAKNGECP